MPQSDYNFSIVKTLRNARGLTLEALSKKTGLSVRTISDIELNKAVPSISSLLSLSESFGVTPTDLFDIAQKTQPKIIKSEPVRLKVTPDDIGNMIELTDLIFIQKKYDKETTIKLSKQSMFHYPCHEVIYVTTGRSVITIEGKDYEVKEKQSLYYASNLQHSFYFDAGTQVLIFYMPRNNKIAQELVNNNQWFDY